MGQPRNKLKKELKEWAIILAIPLLLYLTGTHTIVIGSLQRVVLMTGIFRPTIDIPDSSQKTAAYDFSLINQAGERLDFSDLRGKKVFINFWATWCAPCMAEMPDIQNLYNKVGDEVEFVMISVDHKPEKTWDFANSKGFTFPIYRRNSLIPDVYEREVIPTTFVLSPDGKIVAERHGMAKYDTEEFIEFLRNI